MVASESITPIPEAARVVTMALSMVTISVLAFCLTRRLQFIKDWRSVPFTTGLIIIIYIDSFLFIFTTAILSKAYSLNQSSAICDAAILLCLICYMSTKVLIYYFLVEKVYIIRGSNLPRMKSKLWLFNFFGVLCPYIALVILNFVYRIAYLNNKGTCVIGMQRKALVPLISFDLALNVYLTSLFLHPLRQCYSYQQKKNPALRTMVTRTFIGSCTTLLTSIANLSVLTALNGEPGYICLALCNIDVLFSVMVLHWVSSIDRPKEDTTVSSHKLHKSRASRLQSSKAGESSGKYLELDENTNQHTTTIEADTSNTIDKAAMGDKIEVVETRVIEIERKREAGDGSSWDGAGNEIQDGTDEDVV